MKGVANLFTFAILFGIIVMALAIVMTVGSPTLDIARTNVDLKAGENLMHTLDNAINEVARDGFGSSRLLSFTATKPIEVIPQEDALELKVDLGTMDYFSRDLRGDLIYIGGNDVNCFQQDVNNDGVKDLVLENTFLKAAFQNITKKAPLAALNTSKNIITLTEKTGNFQLNVSDSSIYIDNNQSTAGGTGYSEILREGTSLPVCTVHFFVNSTVSYDIFYRLYAGADFLTVEVRNIK